MNTTALIVFMIVFLIVALGIYTYFYFKSWANIKKTHEVITEIVSKNESVRKNEFHVLGKKNDK